MRFDWSKAVHTFPGEDYEVAVVPPKAKAILSRFYACSQHYEVKAELEVISKRCFIIWYT